MILTGKCEEDFEKWYGNEVDKLDKSKGYYYDIDYFTNSMQYGVYVDFFDTVKFTILISHGFKNNKTIFMPSYENSSGHNFDYNIYYDTRSKARTAAIEKANEIYNKQTSNKQVSNKHTFTEDDVYNNIAEFVRLYATQDYPDMTKEETLKDIKELWVNLSQCNKQ
jgi:hypothetical protein